MITDALYSVNVYIQFCVKRSELSYGHCTIEVLCVIILVFSSSCRAEFVALSLVLALSGSSVCHFILA